MTRLRAILDTSPLITVCAFQIEGQPVIEHLLPLADLVIVPTVAAEATANPTHPDAAIIGDLIDERHIAVMPVPVASSDELVDAYFRLGQGERDTLKLALTIPQASVIFDDHLAIVIAARFGARPVLLLDFLVQLTQETGLDAERGLRIVNTIAGRYSAPFIEHTRQKLKGMLDDPDHSSQR